MDQDTCKTWYTQHLDSTFQTRDTYVLWNEDEITAYDAISQRALVDRCQCYRLIAVGRDLLQLSRKSFITHHTDASK